MTINKLAKEICSREGLKKSVDIAQVKEILRIICELESEAEFYNSQGPVSAIVDQEFKVRKKVWKRLEKLEVEK